MPQNIFSAVMGTVFHDGHCQSVILIHISPEGKHVEYVVSAAKCQGSTALAASNHVKTELKKMIDTKQVVSCCTDGASAYTGCHNGMMEILRIDPDFD